MVRIVLPYKDHKPANVVRKQSERSTQILAQFIQVKRSRMKWRSGKTSRLLWVNNVWCIHFSVACAMQAMSATRADKYTNEEHKGSAIGNHLTEQHDMQPEDITQRFQIFKKVSEQIWLSYFWNVFYQRTETNAKQTVRFSSHQTICLEQFLLRLFYSFPLYILTHFYGFFYLFQHTHANLENLEHLLTWKWRRRGRNVVTSYR